YIYDGVRELLQSADLTVGVYNATMSAEVEHIGCQRTWELVGGPENADALKAAGFDVMAVATNHIKDCGRYACGDRAFFDTLENLRRVGISPVGAGAVLDDALQPVVVDVNGIRFGFVSLGEVNPKVFADFETPGIANLTFFHLKEAIELAQAVSDVVIVMPHSGPEDTSEVTPQQLYWARNSAALGADLVVENHAHVVQGYQAYDDVMAFYSLGNFVFDQIWSRDHQQGVILRVTFQETTMVGFEFFPTVVLQDGTVLLADEQEAAEIVDRIEESSALLGE
ncbi:MAG: CapA family protein, partial [Chloroflexota bacterium]